MTIFKCKMCGGTLEIHNNETVVECEYCGTQQTLPRLEDDRRINLYDRANHFRRNNEYDKAMGIYEQILNEDNTDAEIYWSLVLCRYGIEYVEDPTSRKRVPTVNRAQFTSIYDDDNYKLALQYADLHQRALYEKEAKDINEIQKGILAISQKEEPFDVFICYKETDNNGRRTPDSVLANDLYHQLMQEGFKVFFARITLEDKLGSAYEPYIFAALNSAKVMVVLGTKPEYFNAVWVKNEWSRYLALIKQGEKKMLIPAYKDMDPYGLPEEFSHLQAQDMSKLGFMQDLIRGIKKIIDVQVTNPTAMKETVAVNSDANVAPLLKRAFMFLEDKEWDSAEEYCERVLDIDPECAEAYLGKLMVELKVTSRQNLKNCSMPFSGRNHFQKVMRFADDELKNEIQGYVDFIVNRNLEKAYADALSTMEHAKNEEDYKKAAAQFQTLQAYKDSKQLYQECLEQAEESRLTTFYNKAVSMMNKAEDENAYKIAAEQFNAIKTFKDSEEKAKLCIEKAEISRKDEIYLTAVSLLSHETVFAYKKAIPMFESISEWKDSLSKINDCERGIYEIEQREEEKRIEAERLAEAKRLEEERIAEEKRIEEEKLAEEQRIAEELAAKKRKKIFVITAPIVCACIALVVVLNTVIIPGSKYSDALSLMEEKKYEEAVAIFDGISDYKDSDEKRKESLFLYAISCQNDQQYEKAITVFEQIKGYKESDEKIEECEIAILDNKYNAAVALMNEGKYENAITAFEEISTHKDSKTQITVCMSTLAKTYVSKGDTGNAIKWYEKMGDSESANKVRYDYVQAHKNSTDTLTCEYLKTLKTANYKDATSIYETLYAWSVDLFINTNKDDHSTRLNTIPQSKGGIQCHYKISGGYPGQVFKLKIVHETRWGTDNVVKRDWEIEDYASREVEAKVSDGCKSPYLYPNHASNLYYHRVTIYDAETGRQLASVTVHTPYDR